MGGWTTTGAAWLLLFLGAALLASACDWTADGAARLERRYTSPDTGSEADADAATAISEVELGEVELGEVEGEGLSGRWAMRMGLTGTIYVELLKQTWSISLTNLFIVDLDSSTEDPGDGIARLRFCDQISELDNGNGASDMGRAEVPDALRAALAASALELPLDAEGIAAGTVTWTWGLQGLSEPATEALPTSADDARVWDQDEDDEPGVTMAVISPAGERYMVRRASWDLAAAPLSDDEQRMEGSLAFEVEEVALAASSDLLMTVAPITPAEGPHPYALRRVGLAGDDAAYDCARLRDEHLGLFGPVVPE